MVLTIWRFLAPHPWAPCPASFTCYWRCLIYFVELNRILKRTSHVQALSNISEALFTHLRTCSLHSRLFIRIGPLSNSLGQGWSSSFALGTRTGIHRSSCGGSTSDGFFNSTKLMCSQSQDWSGPWGRINIYVVLKRGLRTQQGQRGLEHPFQCSISSHPTLLHAPSLAVSFLVYSLSTLKERKPLLFSNFSCYLRSF